MTTYNWNVTGGNFGAASSWSPTGGPPTAADGTNINLTTSVFGSGYANYLNIYGPITVTISSAFTTTITTDVLMGSASGAATTVNVNAAWNNINVNNGISVGQNGFGSAVLNVNSGGSLTTDNISVGTNYANSSTAYSGTMTVQSGGAVTITYTTNVGVRQGATGALTVTGTGSKLSTGASLNIGNVGTGTLSLSNGAQINASQLDVGVNYDQPTLASGSGTATIQSGAVLTTTGQYQEIGAGATGTSTDVALAGTGAVTVDGAGSKWIATNGQIAIGDANSKTGTLTVSNGGSVTSTNGLYIGNEWNGADGSYGTLNITSGGTVTSGANSALGGMYAASQSKASVTGAGSKWTVNDLIVNQTGDLSVTSGGAVQVTGDWLGMQGGVVQVDSNSSLEDGSAGGAALGYLTVDPMTQWGSNLWAVGTIEANVIDNGGIYSNEINGQGSLVIEGPTGVADTGTLTGNGWLWAGTQSPLDLYTASVASTLHVQFSGWDSTIGIEATGFSAPIYNFQAGDTLNIQGLAFNGGASSYTFTPSGSVGGGTLVIHEGASSVTLNIASSPTGISGNLTLAATSGGTSVSFTNGAAQSPFTLWSSPGSLFNTSSGIVDGMDYGLSNVTDGGTPVWVDAATPAASYVANGANSYSIELATQDWLGDVQPEITIATDSNFVNPITYPALVSTFGAAPFSALAADTIFSNTTTQGNGAVLYLSGSTGAYSFNFQPFSVTYPSATATYNLVTITGAPVTLLSNIADPLAWTSNNNSGTALVLGYMTKNTNTTENLYFDSFTTGGSANLTAPVLIASNLPNYTPFFVGYYNGSYSYRYLAVNSAVGTGLVGGSFNAATGAVGALSMLVDLPSYTAFTGVESEVLSNGNSLRIIEGVRSGQSVIQVFLNNSPSTAATATATFNLSSSNDYFQRAAIYDSNTNALDYTVVAYTDNNQVHLELLNETGQQIGGDLVVPGITSFLRLDTMQGINAHSSTRVELDYLATDPNGGQEVKSLIYDTASGPYTATLSGVGLWDGSPFDDTYSWGSGVYTIDGGGGTDTLSATSLAVGQVEIGFNASGDVVMTDATGDSDTLRRFSTITLSNDVVNISGKTLIFTAAAPDAITSFANGETLDLQYVAYSGPEHFALISSAGGVGSFALENASNAVLGQVNIAGMFNAANLTAGSDGGSGTDIGFYSQAARALHFNGPAAGSGSVLWYNSVSGTVLDWSLANGSVSASANVAGFTPNSGWSVIGAADVNGDGTTDVLLNYTGGGQTTISDWTVANGTYSGYHAIGGFGTNSGWSVLGTGDFNGDGTADVLLSWTGGGATHLYSWQDSNGTAVATDNLNMGYAVNSGWTVLGVGDFNGDGTSDVLFENTQSGLVADWSVNNGVAGAFNSVAGIAPNSGWTFDGIGDFNGDGVSDVLWQNGGTLALWEMSNGSLLKSVTVSSSAPSGYTFEGISDYFGTGTSGILWQNATNGQTLLWNLSGGQVVATTSPGGADPSSWHVVQTPS